MSRLIRPVGGALASLLLAAAFVAAYWAGSTAGPSATGWKALDEVMLKATGRTPGPVVRQARGTLRAWDGREWLSFQAGETLPPVQAMSAAAGSEGVFEWAPYGFIKLEHETVVVLEERNTNAGPQRVVRVLRGVADIRSITPGSLVLERQTARRVSVVQAPAQVPVQGAPRVEPIAASAPGPRINLKNVGRGVIVDRKPKVSRRLATPSLPRRPPAMKRSVPPAKPAAPAPAMVPQILPIQVE